MFDILRCNLERPPPTCESFNAYVLIFMSNIVRVLRISLLFFSYKLSALLLLASFLAGVLSSSFFNSSPPFIAATILLPYNFICEAASNPVC